MHADRKALSAALAMSMKVGLAHGGLPGGTDGTTKPILRTTFHLKGGALTVRAIGESLDLDIPVPVNAGLLTEEVQVTVQPQAVLDFVRKAGKDDVTLDVTPRELAVTVGKVTARFPAVEALPPIAWPATRPFGTVNAEQFMMALSRVKVAALTRAGGGQAAFRGVLVETKGGVLYVTATDGQQLAVQGVAWTGEDIRLLIRAADVNTLIGAIAAQQSETLTLHGDDGNLMVQGGLLARVRLMDQRAFVDVHSVIPRGTPAAVEVDAGALKRAVSSVMAVHRREEASSPAVELRVMDGLLTVGGASHFASGRVVVEGAAVHTPDFQVVTAARMLQLATNVTGTVSLALPERGTAMVVRCGAYLAMLTRRVGVQVSAPPPRLAQVTPVATPPAVLSVTAAPWEAPAAASAFTPVPVPGPVAAPWE